MTDADRWAKKYYPVPAYKVKKKDAVAHSIRKWSGLSAAVRKRFGIVLVLDDTEVHFLDGSEFQFGTDTCALCAHFLGRFSHVPRNSERLLTCPFT